MQGTRRSRRDFDHSRMRTDRERGVPPSSVTCAWRRPQAQAQPAVDGKPALILGCQQTPWLRKAGPACRAHREASSESFWFPHGL
jgi:hypothetical protein